MFCFSCPPRFSLFDEWDGRNPLQVYKPRLTVALNEIKIALEFSIADGRENPPRPSMAGTDSAMTRMVDRKSPGFA
jgi:hypothetical protein